MQRPVDSPDQVWSNVDQAAAWLGYSVDEFRAFTKKYPDRLPHSEDKAHRWHWRVLVAFSWFLESQTGAKDE